MNISKLCNLTSLMRSGCPPTPVSGPCCITTNTYKAHFVPFNSFKGNSIKLQPFSEERREPRSPFGLQGHHISLHLATQYLLQQTFHTKSSPLQPQTQAGCASAPYPSRDSFCGFGQVASPSKLRFKGQQSSLHLCEEGGR